MKTKEPRMERIFRGMLSRCRNKNHKNYGAKGIIVEWTSYEEFYKDMATKYRAHVAKHGEKNTTIDRKDSNGNYSKENCRWATFEVQAKNTMGIPINANFTERECSICGCQMKGRVTPNTEMDVLCAYDLKITRIKAKYHSEKSNPRRALYWANKLAAMEATRKGVSI